jgi:hypothetical protein
MLEEADANIEDVEKRGKNVWDSLMGHYKILSRNRDTVYPVERICLLRVMVLRVGPPRELVALLSPEAAHVVREGARLRARLPSYLVRRQALLDAYCPLLLPPLCALVHGYMELTTTEELWATGLGQAKLVLMGQAG